MSGARRRDDTTRAEAGAPRYLSGCTTRGLPDFYLCRTPPSSCPSTSRAPAFGPRCFAADWPAAAAAVDYKIIYVATANDPNNIGFVGASGSACGARAMRSIARAHAQAA